MGRFLQEALVKEAVSAGCCLIFLRALPTAYRFWSHAGFTRILDASQQNCLRSLGLLDWLDAVDRDCVRLVKFLLSQQQVRILKHEQPVGRVVVRNWWYEVYNIIFA